MKKTLVSGIAVTAICLFALGGCNKPGTLVVSSDTIGYSNAKTKITWLPQEGLDSPNKPVADYLAATTKAWAEKHPDVKIVVAAQGNQIQDAMAKMLVQAAAGNAPDIASVDSFILPSFWDVLQPVDDVLQAKKIPLDSWFHFAQQLMKPKDKTLAMWYDTDVRMFYYQKALMNKAPKDWDELLAVAKDMKAKGYVSFLYPAGRNETTTCDVLPWFWSQGGKLVDDSGAPVFFDGANKAAMLNVFNFMKLTVTSGISPDRKSVV
jgi:multiple sugar transport system substrate-binding protein